MGGRGRSEKQAVLIVALECGVESAEAEGTGARSCSRISKWVAKLMEKEPAKRHHSAEEALRGLQQVTVLLGLTAFLEP
jgi:hypothetical protein